MKTTAGDKRDDGSRRCSLGKDVLYQLLGYVLLDWNDTYGLDSIALYAARFNYLRQWNIESLIVELGSACSSLNELREKFQHRLMAELPSPADLRMQAALAWLGRDE
jgi:hypothetical protein